jgi:hypothetical protein
MLPPILVVLMAVGVLATTAAAARAKDVRNGLTPPRLGFIDGDVSFLRPGAEDWIQAQVNTALAPGDSIYAGDGANLELQIGPRAFVRAGANTEIGLESLEPDYMQFRVTGGHAAFDFQRLRKGQVVEVDTPNAAYTIDRAGYYRVDVDQKTSGFSVRRGGAATVISAGDQSTDLRENQQVVLEGTETAQVALNAAPEPDQWDRWNYDRTSQYGEAPRSAQYVPAGIAGVDDLDRYGDWRETPQYGRVWAPRDVSPEWAPYTTGRWVYDPYYEWTWVDQAPWGWAPYHYGRWVNAGGYWGWAPGPVVVAPVYAPALVAFLGAPGGGVSVGISAPFVSWVALGFGEPVIPWWGGPRFAGTASWGGWGGPRIVNNVVVSNTTIVNVRNINTFTNASVKNAVVAVNRDRFGRGQGQQIPLAGDRAQLLRPVHGGPQVKPVAASLVPSETRGHRPPDNLRARGVVATRQPQDTTKRLERQGLNAPSAVAIRPEPRIVEPRRGIQGVAAERSAPGQRAIIGLQGEGQQPPGPPGRRGARGATGSPGNPGQPQPGGHTGQLGAIAPERGVPPSSGGEHQRPGWQNQGSTPPPPSHGAGSERRPAPPPPSAERAAARPPREATHAPPPVASRPPSVERAARPPREATHAPPPVASRPPSVERAARPPREATHAPPPVASQPAAAEHEARPPREAPRPRGAEGEQNQHKDDPHSFAPVESSTKSLRLG